MRIMSVTPENKKSGSKEMLDYCRVAQQSNVKIIVFPSSFLPYYKNQSAFYSEEDSLTLPNKLVDIINSDLVVIVGVNAKMNSGKQYKQVIAFNKQAILHSHLKRDLEEHYIEKGFSPGNGKDFSFAYSGLVINTLECYEVLFSRNYVGANIITGSVGFGMKAQTENYNCDYFDQWSTIVKSHCLYNSCYAILSCNGQHDDSMTLAINREGEIIGMARKTGYFVIDIDPNEFYRNKNPFIQEEVL